MKARSASLYLAMKEATSRLRPGTVVPSRTSRAFINTFWRGAAAAARGLPRICPYRDKLNVCGPTFSRAFRRYWFDGYDAVGPRKAHTESANQEQRLSVNERGGR